MRYIILYCILELPCLKSSLKYFTVYIYKISNKALNIHLFTDSDTAHADGNALGRDMYLSLLSP